VASPKVCFYPLHSGGMEDALVIACRLTEKACGLGHRVHLLARSESQVKQLDQLLWQFRPESFIPHQCLVAGGDDPDPGIRVTLGTAEQVPAEPEVLINLHPDVWEEHPAFRDIREIVAADEEERSHGRQRYRFYQDRGYPLQTQQLRGS